MPKLGYGFEPGELFKYLEPRWADEMTRYGSVRIATLVEFREYEATDLQRRDAEEGTRKVIGDPGPVVYTADSLPTFARGKIRMAPGSELEMVTPGATLSATYTIPDAYVYSTTEGFDEEVMREFGGACVRIHGPIAFFNAIHVELVNGPLGISLVTDGRVDRCVYVSREQHYRTVTPAHECFLKDPRFAPQGEVRGAWLPTSPRPTSVVVRSQRIATCCERIH